MMAKKIYQPNAQVVKAKAPPAICSRPALAAFPSARCQYEAVRQEKAHTRVKNIILDFVNGPSEGTIVKKTYRNTKFVRSASIMYRKQSKPIASRKKPGSRCIRPQIGNFTGKRTEACLERHCGKTSSRIGRISTVVAVRAEERLKRARKAQPECTKRGEDDKGA